MFYKECDVLASMSHPNIVEIFDIGEFEEDGARQALLRHAAAAGRNAGSLIAPTAAGSPSTGPSKLFPRPAGDCRRRMNAA